MEPNMKNRVGALSAFAGAAAMAMVFVQPARADHDDWRWHGHIEHFNDHDWGMWHNGYWRREYHDGRLGWWWVVGPTWYYYPQPVYPYPNPYEPPVVVIAPQAPAKPAPPPPPPPAPQNWYYCESARGYYPYVPECPSGWRAVPATPGAPPGTPPG